MKMKRRMVAQAALMAVSSLVTSLTLACPIDSAKPFTSGPIDAQGMFSQWIVDSNGVALQTCTDTSTTIVGAPCLSTPVVPGNALSETLGRGVEAFMFLANSVFTTPGTAPIDAVIVMGVETAFLSPVPMAGFQTQFQRLRIRLNVSAIGDYTVETPWGTSSHHVAELLAPGNGQNRAEISVPVDVTFQTDSSVPGLVAPFLIADQKPALTGMFLPSPVPNGRPIPVNPADYIGDGVTLTTVTGSPCGQNYVKITGVAPDGTPIPINTGNGAAAGVYTNNLFTVSGKKTALAKVPLNITSAYYERNGGNDTAVVMANGSTSSTGSASMTISTVSTTTTAPMVRDGARYYANLGLPTPTSKGQQVSVTATDLVGTPNTRVATLIDLVTIDKAEATCTGTGALRSCNLIVNASSSDDGSVTPVTLTLAHANQALANGTTSVTSAAVPAVVTVNSSQLGTASRAVTIINK